MSARDGYYSTLIVPAPDCRVIADIPQEHAGKVTIAMLHYMLINAVPYGLTQEDVLFETWLQQQCLTTFEDTPQRRDEFFSKSRACLRSSPLGKRYGWAIHFDTDGRVALVAPGTDRYDELVADKAIKVRAAMRSIR